MRRLDAAETAALLTELSRRTALAGGPPYRARAYARAAESVSALATPLEMVIAQGRLREIPGVGEAIADIITKLHETGMHPTLEKLRTDYPAGVLEMLSIPGMRPDKAGKLYTELGIATLGDLEAAARSDQLKGLKGFGPALQRKILEGLQIRESTPGARHLHRAAALIDVAERDVRRSLPGVVRVTAAGDFRRGAELVSNLALVAEVTTVGEQPRAVKTGDMTVFLTDAERYGITLLLATGSNAHLHDLRALAERNDLALTIDGMKHGDGIVASMNEEDVYDVLGLPFIPPELREGRGEVALARRRKLPRLVKLDDIKGILHAHTVASDGANTLEEMAEATRERGYAYFGVADHSVSARYAGGLSVEEIEEQHDTIDRLNAGYRGRFRIFKGIESDILADGSLDYPDKILRSFDFVVASIHSRFRLDRTTQTERLLKAIANPFTTIIGHMTGRQLLRRTGYDIDVEKVLAACAKHGVAVEINANPWRLDLDWRWHARGLELGCLFSINPDAHSMSEIDLMRWGVSMARKGGIPADRILNCRDLKAFGLYLKRRRQTRERV